MYVMLTKERQQMKNFQEKTTISNIEKTLVKHRNYKTVCILTPLQLAIIGTALHNFECNQYTKNATNETIDLMDMHFDRCLDKIFLGK